jgi:hypothetical protein
MFLLLACCFASLFDVGVSDHVVFFVEIFIQTCCITSENEGFEVIMFGGLPGWVAVCANCKKAGKLT